MQQSAIVSAVSRLLNVEHICASSSGCQDPRLRTQRTRKILLRVSKNSCCHVVLLKKKIENIHKQFAILLSDVPIGHCASGANAVPSSEHVTHHCQQVRHAFLVQRFGECVTHVRVARLLLQVKVSLLYSLLYPEVTSLHVPEATQSSSGSNRQSTTSALMPKSAGMDRAPEPMADLTIL